MHNETKLLSKEMNSLIGTISVHKAKLTACLYAIVTIDHAQLN